MSKHTEHIAFFIRQKLHFRRFMSAPPRFYCSPCSCSGTAPLPPQALSAASTHASHADSLAVPVYFTRVPMHEQPRGAGAVSPAFPRNASCVPPTRLRRSRRFVGAHRRLPYRREDHRKFIRGRKAHKGTGGAAVMLLYRAGLCVCGSLYGRFIVKKRAHRAEFIFCLRTCAVTSGTHPVALCRKTRKKPKTARICSRRHRLRCAGRH